MENATRLSRNHWPFICRFRRFTLIKNLWMNTLLKKRRFAGSYYRGRRAVVGISSCARRSPWPIGHNQDKNRQDSVLGL